MEIFSIFYSLFFSCVTTSKPHIKDHNRPLIHKNDENWIGPQDTDPKLIADNSFFNHHESIAVIDDVITESDCEALLNLANNVVKLGDGYQGNKAPHNKNELFYGATLSEVADRVNKNEIHISYLYIYYYLAERVRRQVQAWNNLDHLYQDYVHLVCRDVVEDIDEKEYQKDIRDWMKSNKARLTNHMSHPIHSDNCRMLNNGTCQRERPAYVWREYSAIVYLDDSFTGGDFILADHTGKQVIANIESKCGRMATFCAGKECLHGVKSIRKGRRCALAQWFTLDFSRRDGEHEKVKELLKKHAEELKGAHGRSHLEL